ncbi:MAG: restriction endonuclease subunit S [Flavobacteriaceae bacterium]|nr:restriction endonuclease subunit S [Flavobacteriaceae bacterium]
MSEWKKHKLADVCEAIFSGGTPNTREKSYWEGKFKWLSSGETRSKFICSTERTITELGIEESSTRLALKGDIVIASAGQGHTRGQTSFLLTDTFINQSIVAIRTNKEVINPLWLFYNLSSRYEEMRQISDSHSSRGSLTTALIRNMEVMHPPIEVQEKIAKQLYSLDQKIELNNQTNQTLEAIAQAIFKSWFVDFDPVKAKVAVLESGGSMEEANLSAMQAISGKSAEELEQFKKSQPKAYAELKETAEAFPSAFVESELGLIPEGWEVTSIGEKLTVVLGGTPSRQKPAYWEKGTIPWINSGMVNLDRIIKPSEFITELGLTNSATKLVPKHSTLVAITGATLGQISYTEIETCTNQSVVSVIENQKVHGEFIHGWITCNIEKLISSQTGGAQQHINKGNVSDLLFLIPSEKVLSAHKILARNIYCTIANNLFENETLSFNRDALLPRLLSGEINVSSLSILESEA